MTGATVPEQSRALFAALYRRQYGPIIGYAQRRTGDRAVAEDITAEVFRIAWERCAAEPPTRAWLFVTARNLVQAHHRANRRASALHDRLVAEHRTGAPVLPAGDDVLAALGRLPEDQRELLMARYWDDLDAGDCAALCHCSVGTLWVRLHRARAALRRELTKGRA
ncbi:RNA polymerase sigma factor [Micropruina sp.]|uniref:RNA polymerase sigma factor n=1 Tax=Micropruina sp. TaxID=2737536 RepID=UPI0039E3AB2A